MTTNCMAYEIFYDKQRQLSTNHTANYCYAPSAAIDYNHHHHQRVPTT